METKMSRKMSPLLTEVERMSLKAMPLFLHILVAPHEKGFILGLSLN